LSLTYFADSFLRKLDKKNFDQPSIDLYFQKTLEFVYDLFEETVHEVTVLPSSVKATALTTKETLVPMDHVNISEQEMELYSSVNDEIESENVVVINLQHVQDRKREELRAKIKSSMDEYKLYCKSIVMATYLEENGNDYYKSMVAKNSVEKIRIQSGDALYVSKFIDVGKWWKKYETKFPELAMGASIVLGKPTHNAFQERVFSRGTYSDTKLRKRLKEEHFEMSVINAVNGKYIDEIYSIMRPSIMLREKDRQKELKLFMEKRKNEMDLNVLEIDEEDDNSVPEFASICSEKTDLEQLDDEEEDDISINTSQPAKLDESSQEKLLKLV
jgi:hypothetical protein